MYFKNFGEFNLEEKNKEMKKYLILFAILPILAFAQSNSKTALLLIDIQDFYFPGGNSALVEPEASADKAAQLLKVFRDKKQTVIHIRHDYEPGGNIHSLVGPISGEKVITKKEVNSYKNTDLLAYLQANKIDTLVLAGMQTHLCLEAAVRASYDYDFICIVIDDACATKDLVYNNFTIKAKEVHQSTLHSLRSYAKIFKLEEYLRL